VRVLGRLAAKREPGFGVSLRSLQYLLLPQVVRIREDLRREELLSFLRNEGMLLAPESNMGGEQSMSRQLLVGIGVLITKDDRVLLVKRGNSYGDGIWSTPGGHLQYGENPEECAMRETQGDIGVLINDVTFLAITNDVFELQEKHCVTIWMAARYVSGVPTMNAAPEMPAVDWFSWDALPEPLFSPFEKLLTGICYPSLWDFSGEERA